MHILSVVSAVLALILAVHWAIVGATGLTGALKRNRWFGVRSDETLRSEEAFALANKVAGPGFCAAALIMLIGGVLAFGGDLGFLFGFGSIVVGFVVVSIVAGLGVRAAATVPAPADEGGCSADCCSGGSDDAATGSCGTDTAASDPASDCGQSSCGSCALQGMCTTEHAADEPADAAH